MNDDKPEREKMPTQTQEIVLEIKEGLDLIEKKLKPILKPVPQMDKSQVSDSSQLVSALAEVLEQVHSLEDRIDL